jgi:hypothetical protein
VNLKFLLKSTDTSEVVMILLCLWKWISKQGLAIQLKCKISKFKGKLDIISRGKIKLTTVNETITLLWSHHLLFCFFFNKGLSSHGSWIYNYLCNQCLSPLKLRVQTLFIARWTRYNEFNSCS